VKLTNRHDLPDAIVRAIANDDYDRGECHLSVSQLIAPPRQVALMRQHGDEIVQDATDLIWALLGKVGHVILERAEQNALVEERLFMDVAGWRISGAMDRFALLTLPHEAWGIDDYKFTSTYAVREGGKVEWEQQLNLYAELLRRHSFPVSRLRIVALLRDWRPAEAKKYARDGYPQQQVAVIPIRLWTPEETLAFAEQRVRLHQEAQWDLPLCTPEERWQREAKWAVMTPKRVKAVKLHDTRADADAHAATVKDAYVEERPAIAKRCEAYCSVRPFCMARNDGQFQPGDLPEEEAA